MYSRLSISQEILTFVVRMPPRLKVAGVTQILRIQVIASVPVLCLSKLIRLPKSNIRSELIRRRKISKAEQYTNTQIKKSHETQKPKTLLGCKPLTSRNIDSHTLKLSFTIYNIDGHTYIYLSFHSDYELSRQTRFVIKIYLS